MLRFPSNQVRRGPLAGSTSGYWARRARPVFLLLVIFAFLGMAGETAGQQKVEPEAVVQPAPGSLAGTVQETLTRIDDLLSEFDTRIAGIQARAQELLDQADAAQDPDEQMRLEELYGRMTATAQGLEEQRSTLRQLRDELAASIDAAAP